MHAGVKFGTELVFVAEENLEMDDVQDFRACFSSKNQFPCPFAGAALNPCFLYSLCTFRKSRPSAFKECALRAQLRPVLNFPKMRQGLSLAST